jgi:hypothetical protein
MLWVDQGGEWQGHLLKLKIGFYGDMKKEGNILEEKLA